MPNCMSASMILVLNFCETTKRPAEPRRRALQGGHARYDVLDLGFGVVGAEAGFGQLDLFVDVVAQFGEPG